MTLDRRLFRSERIMGVYRCPSTMYLPIPLLLQQLLSVVLMSRRGNLGRRRHVVQPVPSVFIVILLQCPGWMMGLRRLLEGFFVFEIVGLGIGGTLGVTLPRMARLGSRALFGVVNS